MDAETDLAVRGRAMRGAGWWTDQMMDDHLGRSLREHPDKTALVAYRLGRDDPERFTYRELCERVGRAAVALHGLGIRRGDVVSVQLPNGWPFVVTILACARIGAVVNPLMPIFRERELRFMLGFAETKLLIVPREHRGFDHEAMAEELRSGLPGLTHVVVVDGAGPDAFETCLQSVAARPGIEPPDGSRPATPDDLSVLMFTSGTTGSPKGVMHSSNTLGACMTALTGRFGIGAQDVYLASTPMGHMTGYVAVVLLGLRNGGTVVLQDVWDPVRGVDIMIRESVSYFAGSTPFLNDILRIAAERGQALPSLRTFLCGGAPIPPALIERARTRIGLLVCSLWGMTEVLSGTLTEPERAGEKSASTDGRPLDGMQILIVDPAGSPVPAGQPGRLLVQGAQMFLGYYKRPDLPTFDPSGWFDSGDLAYADEEGYIRICGRTKDVLIRGGENVPVVEIESLLLELPAVRSAAIVGIPDARLGERACAFVVLEAGSSLDLAAVRAHMQARRVARQYWPEMLRVIDEMPCTPSGKVQKFKLREHAAAFVIGD